MKEGRLAHARHRQRSSRPKLGVAVGVAAAAVAVPLPWASGILAETTLIVVVLDSTTVARPVFLLRPLALVAVATAGRVALVDLLRT